MDTSRPLELTEGLDRWEITFRNGERATVWAHGVKELDGCYVFVALMRGEPHFEMELCRMPAALVEDLVGG